MKIILKSIKPRYKWLDDILRSKKNARHVDPRFVPRHKQKILTRKQLNAGLRDD